MGKIKGGRKKFHISNNTEKASGSAGYDSVSNLAVGTYVLKNPLPLPDSSNDIFSGVTISSSDLKQSIKADDVRSVLSFSKRDFKDKYLSKKERRTKRHETFINEINMIQLRKKEEKARKKRQKTVITGDLRPLADALPSLEPVKESKKNGKSNKVKKKRSILKIQDIRKQTLQDIKMFQKVMADSSYKSDPTGVMSNFIQEKMKQELTEK